MQLPAATATTLDRQKTVLFQIVSYLLHLAKSLHRKSRLPERKNAGSMRLANPADRFASTITDSERLVELHKKNLENDSSAFQKSRCKFAGQIANHSRKCSAKSICISGQLLSLPMPLTV